MSLGARATKGGGKGKEKHGQDKATKAMDKPQPKEKIKPQATTEQIRMANMIDRKSDDASDVRQKVTELMEMTRCTEEEVCSALHDADNDITVACNLLLEETTRIQGQWQTNEKKKKKPPAAAAGNGEPDPPPAREPRSRSGPRPRRGEGEPGRGRWSGRGRGAGRGGRMQRRMPRNEHHGHAINVEDGNVGDSFPTTEDWDNEEWSGSLSDTKVFTPSVNAQNVAQEPEPATSQNNSTEDWETGESNGGHDHIQTYNYNDIHTQQHNIREQQTVVAGGTQESPSQDNYHSNHHHQPMGMSGSLSAAQSQYLSQLTQQAQRHDASMYSNNYGVYGAELAQRKQRARVPPPSKIPALAVEMPGGCEGSGALLDVQFGALDPAALRDTQPPPAVCSDPPVLEAVPEPAPVYSAPLPAPTMSESISQAVESAPAQQPVPVETPVSTNNNSLDKQLSSSMKQMSVSTADATHTYAPHAHYTHHNNKPVTGVSAVSQNVYGVSHHPPLYPPAVYAPQQTSSTSAGAAYAAPPLTQYQPGVNSYQTSASGGVYGGSALYTQYTPPHNKLNHKDNTQYESSVASVSNSLTSTSTTQTTTAKVTSTTVSSASSVSAPAYPALYGPNYTHYDDIRPHTAHHMTGYYEVGYGSREAGFGVGAGERFGRREAASPQQAPQVAAALPPGYAYFYQPPPTTYQYGVYPTYGGSSAVGGVGSVGGVSGAAAAAKVTNYTQQPPYDAQDTYKQPSAYTGGSKAAAGADISSAMYAKQQLALNKLNSYEKATFHSGTPPPFGAASHLYIPAHHHPHHQHHQHQHQMDVRLNSSLARRAESVGAGARSASNKPAPTNKPTYSQSYWPPN